ncbi:MAG TPA: type 1 glutamine amidotransferase [Burkholderiales bacterium]|jgi:GMP synthase-like glutamine amidotransferase|nr:type 1 glutamine amidotransferase [Burkholderiales bacterium]
MKPVVIMRHAPTEGPGYFATFLERHRLAWQLVKVDEGQALPADVDACSALAFMGGPMSANDDLPWVAAALALIRRAVDAGIPVVGHCLGAQLMAKAMGASVTRNPVKEIGWGTVEIVRGPAAETWLGPMLEPFEAFHWHGETFSIPPGAARLAGSAHCENQIFVRGPHLGMQCHVEMTPELIRTWCRDWGREVQWIAARMPSVQTPAEMTERLDARVAALHAVADRLYQRWISALAKS